MIPSFDIVWKKTHKWEGGFVDDPDDRGGATNHGITEAIARKNGYTGDMKDLSEQLAKEIAFGMYWLKNRCNEVDDQRVAETLFDCCFNHGHRGGGRIFQKAINSLVKNSIKVDGDIGTMTLSAYTEIFDKDKLADRMILERVSYYADICNKKRSQTKFLLGWINRARSFI